jgi:putative IMPACT (imprinted ancient) family translation regulator
MEVQHTLKIRISKSIVDVSCPPFASEAQLDAWLAQIKSEHPDYVIVSKSWRTDAPT